MLKFDLHMHSWYSYDSLNDPKKIAKAARHAGLDGIAITDHNVFRVDWTDLQSSFPDLIIVPGMEIGTKGVGDILCYFIKEEIKSKIPADVIKEVKNQGGISVLAHPYHHGRSLEDYPDELIERLDAIETNNAHNTKNDDAAAELAARFSKPRTAGSDAHFLSEIGCGITFLGISRSEAKNEQTLKKAFLNPIEVRSTPTPAYSFHISQTIKYLKRFKILPQR